MAVKHTPGPWIAEISTLKEAKDDGDFGWMSMGSGPHSVPPETLVGTVWRVCEGGGSTGLPGSIETTAANARLIAAAPEMAEALREYMEWGAMTGSDRDLFDQRFRALLARIDGEQA